MAHNGLSLSLALAAYLRSDLRTLWSQCFTPPQELPSSENIYLLPMSSEEQHHLSLSYITARCQVQQNSTTRTLSRAYLICPREKSSSYSAPCVPLLLRTTFTVLTSTGLRTPRTCRRPRSTLRQHQRTCQVRAGHSPILSRTR